MNIVKSLPIPRRIGAFRRVSRGRWTHWWRRWWSPAEMRRGSRILKGLRSLSKKWWKTVKSLGGRTMIRLIWLPQLKRSFASWVQQIIMNWFYHHLDDNVSYQLLEAMIRSSFQADSVPRGLEPTLHCGTPRRLGNHD